MEVFAGCEEYQPEYEPLPKQSRIYGMLKDRFIALSVTFGIAVILAIAIPLGIILPQRLIKPLPINVLIPFYMYPAPGAWEPLFEAYATFTSVVKELILMIFMMQNWQTCRCEFHGSYKSRRRPWSCGVADWGVS